jgi:hypothetical protein
MTCAPRRIPDMLQAEACPEQPNQRNVGSRSAEGMARLLRAGRNGRGDVARLAVRCRLRRPSHYAELARPAIVRDRLIGAVLDDDLDARSETDALRSEV